MVIGTSVEGRPIEAKRLGNGPVPVVLIGGIHGGYEWNTVVLAGMLLERFRETPELLPRDISLYVVEAMNIDGLVKITGGTPPGEFDYTGIGTAGGRVNARGVDLNRNWDNNWQAEARWGRFEVSGGSSPFSEPETRAARDFLLRIRPAAVIFYHSAADGIYYGGARAGNEEGRAIALAYSEGSGYRVAGGADASGNRPTPLVGYRVTGGASGYLHSRGINSMVVELKNHRDTDFEENLGGLISLFDHLSER